MARAREVSLELPKEEFQAVLAALNAPDVAEAFAKATADLARKEQRNRFVNYFALDSGYGEATAAASGAEIVLDRKGIVSVTLPEASFKTILGEAATAEGKNLSAAFSEASAELDRKQSRNFVVKYFDLFSEHSSAEIPGHPKARLGVCLA
jgi:hypothetical protein